MKFKKIGLLALALVTSLCTMSFNNGNSNTTEQTQVNIEKKEKDILTKDISFVKKTAVAPSLAQTVNCTVEPSNAKNKTLTWNISWVDATDTRDITQYMRMRPSTDTLSCNFNCIYPFDSQLKVTVSTTDGSGVEKSFTLDYMSRKLRITPTETEKFTITKSSTNEDLKNWLLTSNYEFYDGSIGESGTLSTYIQKDYESAKGYSTMTSTMWLIFHETNLTDYYLLKNKSKTTSTTTYIQEETTLLANGYYYIKVDLLKTSTDTIFSLLESQASKNSEDINEVCSRIQTNNLCSVIYQPTLIYDGHYVNGSACDEWAYNSANYNIILKNVQLPFTFNLA